MNVEHLAQRGDGAFAPAAGSPFSLAAGKPLAVAVAAADASGKLVTGFGGPITQTADVGSVLFLGLTIANVSAFSSWVCGQAT